ncbi:LuxR C-terminal-related transcriptional regulator [Streptosporangium sandarakinum]|uniref:LuxR C-terminal-related transcriptional regulator n=1 Tax=Streptosporangium sandarakinum TaxID=1260955 RepID=UPI0028AC7D57|nr:LuxR C-terminal-related transcriptional regulator [Streptosporangium sandarakinum]
MPLHPVPLLPPQAWTDALEGRAVSGSALFIAKTTVKTHINNAFAKIGVCNRTEAAAYRQAALDACPVKREAGARTP